MATNNIFKTSGINARERKMLTINDFGGVDYMANPLAVSSSRAVEMQNFIKRDGVNQKRFGWQQISKLTDSDGNPLIVRNIWHFVASYKNDLHPFETVVAYTSNGKFWTPNKNFFDVNASKYEQLEWTELLIWNGEGNNVELELPDKELQAFVSDNKIFILTGVKYLICYLSHESNDLRITLAENPYEIETYVPTVLTGVPRTPTPLDDFNLLNSRIKVKGTFYTKQDVEFNYAENPEKYNKTVQYYSLSSKIKELNNVIPTVYIKNTDEASGREYLNDLFSTSNIYSSYPKNTYIATNNKKIVFSHLACIPQNNEKLGENGVILLPRNPNHSQDLSNFFGSWNSWEKLINCGGQIIIGFADDTGSFFVTNIGDKAVIFDNSNNSYSGLEFEVTYDCGKSNPDNINKCTIGCIYNNDFFISGNPEKPNIDYHTSGGINNFTYFSDLDYCSYGTPLTSIKGYNIMNDGSLCVLKEESSQEPTIYFRTITTNTATAYDGSVVVDSNGNTLTETHYPLTTGNIGEGLINTNSFKTFVQDTVFLSKNGLFGITTGSNYNSNVKTTRERSRFVNPRLKNYNLENVSTIIFDNKYFISLKDDEGTIYIADSRYKTELTDDLYTYQYEWWVWKNVHAENFFVVGNKLFFSKQDGTLNVFTENSFCDTKVKQSTSVAYDLTVNDDVFISNDLPEKANFIYIDNAIFYEDGDALNNTLPIKVLSNNEFQIIDENGNARNITRVELKNSDSLSIKFIIKTPVECLYETVPFSFGTTLHSKYLYQYSLTNNTVEGSKYALGIRTSDELLNPYEDVVDSTSGINFDYFTFMNVSFAQKDFARSYIFKYRVPNINFVQFLFWNRGEENCSVSSLQLLYTIGLVQKGVK